MRDGGFLAGIDHFLARSIGLVAHLDALHGVLAGRQARAALTGLPLSSDADGLAIDEDFDAVHVGLENQGAELRRGRGGGLGVRGNVGQQHVGIEAAAVGSGVLLAVGASRTWVWTYSASSSAVTMPSPEVSAAPSMPFTT